MVFFILGDPDHEIGESLGQQFDDMYVKLVSMKTAGSDFINTSLLIGFYDTIVPTKLISLYYYLYHTNYQ